MDKTMVMNEGVSSSPSENGSTSEQEEPICPNCKEPLKPAPLSKGIYFCPSCGYVCDQAIELNPGTVLMGKYRILKPLGAGGCSDIYLCHPLEDAGKRYVLKVLSDVTTPASQQRFEREAKLLKMLTLPVIVQFIDYWTAPSGSYLIMEYVEGCTLVNIFDKYVIDEETTLQIALEVAKALKFAWDMGKIIHRDIKPSNIMISDKMEVKLLDFGMGKRIELETADITANNAGLGTPKYMSPEQYNDAKNVDFRSDIYSLGITMFYLLKKKSPISGKDIFEIYKDTVRNSPPPDAAFMGVCSSECASLIQHMMQLEPEKRPESYDDLIGEIKDVLNQLSS